MICDKVSYATQKLANDAMAKMSTRDHDQYKKYKCEHCGNFHIATARKKGRMRTSAVKETSEHIEKPQQFPKHIMWGNQENPPLSTEKVFASLLNKIGK